MHGIGCGLCTHDYMEKFTENLKVYRKCGSSLVGVQETECALGANPKYLNNEETYHNEIYTSANNAKVVLSDLTFLSGGYPDLDNCNEIRPFCYRIYVDINGGNKGPNQYGKDLFIFNVTTSGVVPNSDDDCKLNSFGYGCSSYILKNKNMNYPEK